MDCLISIIDETVSKLVMSGIKGLETVGSAQALKQIDLGQSLTSALRYCWPLTKLFINLANPLIILFVKWG